MRFKVKAVSRNKHIRWSRVISTLFLLLIPYSLCSVEYKNIHTEYLDADFTYSHPDGTCTYYFGTGYARMDGIENVFLPNPTSETVPQYYYYTKDHLGNIRSVVTKNPSTNVISEVQRTHYYPYGGIIADISTGQNTQPRLYSSKELDMMHGLRWHDHGARFADNNAPLCEKYYDTSPYVFCGNNMMKYFDPDGKDLYKLTSKGYIIYLYSTFHHL